MPKIPWFRDWFEKKFGNLCAMHDLSYAHGECKLCADWALFKEIWRRGYRPLAPFVFLAVNMPWVWWLYFKNRKGK